MKKPLIQADSQKRMPDSNAFLTANHERPTDDSELEKINTGGYYYNVQNCPSGKTKLMEYFVTGVDFAGEGCTGCEYLVRKPLLRGSYQTCAKTVGDRQWEN